MGASCTTMNTACFTNLPDISAEIDFLSNINIPNDKIIEINEKKIERCKVIKDNIRNYLKWLNRSPIEEDKIIWNKVQDNMNKMKPEELKLLFDLMFNIPRYIDAYINDQNEDKTVSLALVTTAMRSYKNKRIEIINRVGGKSSKKTKIVKWVSTGEKTSVKQKIDGKMCTVSRTIYECSAKPGEKRIIRKGNDGKRQYVRVKL